MPLVANKVTERDLRDYLSSNGFYGRSARISDLNLAAVERPGWVQVFRFHVRAKRVDGDWEEHFGLVRTDERHDVFDVQLFAGEADRQSSFERDTRGTINGIGEPRHWSYRPLMLLFLAAAVLAIAGALFRVQ